MKKKLFFASKNKGKIREVASIFGDGVEIVSPLDYDETFEVIEDGDTFESNAIKKAREAYERFGTPALADDSGLVVDQLDGAPGVYSARYAGEPGDDEANNRKVLRELDGKPEPHAARFVCCAVYHDGAETVVATGKIEGRIIHTPRGENGFGYDPLFLPEGYDRTTAEMSLEEKNKISHRARAFTELQRKLSER